MEALVAKQQSEVEHMRTERRHLMRRVASLNEALQQEQGLRQQEEACWLGWQDGLGLETELAFVKAERDALLKEREASINRCEKR